MNRHEYKLLPYVLLPIHDIELSALHRSDALAFQVVDAWLNVIIGCHSLFDSAYDVDAERPRAGRHLFEHRFEGIGLAKVRDEAAAFRLATRGLMQVVYAVQAGGLCR